MDTKFYQIKLNENDTAATVAQRYGAEIAEAAQLLQAGEIVAFPTETVYGLGGNALVEASVSKIYAAKGRPSDNPLIVHVAAISQVGEFAEVSPLAEKLMSVFCPGPLTLVLPKKSIVPKAVTGGLETVAIRIPCHPVALAMLMACGLPIAAPSANISGKPSPTTGRHVYQDLAGKIAMVLDSGSAGVGVESTVLDLSSDVPVILRPGAVTKADLLPYCPQILEGGAKVADGVVPKAPGMKYKHYAPNGEVQLFAAADLSVAYEQAVEAAKNQKIMVLATDEILAKLSPEFKFSLGTKQENLAEVAQNVFAALRYADEIGAELILCQSFPKDGIGSAIMNRLQKAAFKA